MSVLVSAAAAESVFKMIGKGIVNVSCECAIEQLGDFMTNSKLSVWPRAHKPAVYKVDSLSEARQISGYD